MISLLPSLRLRTVGFVALFSFTTFFVSLAPTDAPVPRPETLAPAPVQALGCATEPSFTGFITNTYTTTPATFSTTGLARGYISNVDAAWSCTAFYRYDGLAWMRDDGEGDANYQWGNLINSTSVPCNWVVGETSYLKANDAAHCHTSDSDHGMQLRLEHFTGDLQEGVWHADNSPDAPGDFMFVHSDCTSYYAGSGTPGERTRWNVTFAGTDVLNRPGDNCDPSVIDGTGTTQSIVVDGTAPTVAFDWPAAGGPAVVTSAGVGVTFDATDAVAGFSGTDDWELQRQTATWNGSTCGTFANDTTTAHLTVGITSANDQVVSQGLVDSTCYRWTVAARDRNGNVATTVTSGTVRTDLTGSLGSQSQHSFESWDLGGGDSLAVNVGTGNLVIEHPVVDLPIRGGSFGIGLTYNRHDPTNVGIGPGWRLDTFRRLAIDAGTGAVTFTAGDGSRHVFTAPVTVGTVTTYTRPATLYATLVKDTSQAAEFTLTYRDQTVDQFDLFGATAAVLVAERDRFGTGVDVTYMAGTTNIDLVTDPAGRTIDFTWDTAPTPDRLTSIRDWAVVSGGVVQTSGTPNRTHRFFYDGSGNLSGWADPLNTANSCTAGQPSPATHVTCLVPSAGRLDITKTQTVTTLSSGTLGTSVRSGATAVTTRVEFSNADVTAVLDAEEKQAAGAGTAFAHPAATATSVVRRGDGASSSDTTTRYTRASSGDVHGRITTVARKLGAAWITTTTAFDATYPIEVASVTEDDGGSLERTTTHQYVAASMGLLLVTKEPLTTTPSVTRRWTQYTYNANNDVTQKTVSLDGSATVRTVTRYCYAASGCATSGTTATMRAVIENYVDGTKGGAQGHEEDITTEYLYDAYGQRTRETRYNYAAGALADDRATGFVYDTFGNLTKEIDNYVDGVVSPNSLDTTPAAGSSVRTDLTTTYAYDTAGNRVATTDPRRAIAASSTTYARDAFERTVADGWGTADTGGAWSGTTADHDVTGSVGAVILGSNTNRNAYLTSVSAQDAEILFKVNVDQLAVGSDHLVWAYLRRQDSSNYYQVRITLNTSGSITATFNRTAAGSSTVIDAATTTVPHAVSDWYWVRARISGTTAVEGRIRLWKDGTTEPVEWAAEGTDASPPAALQGTGHVGLRFQLGGSYSGTYPVTASFDEFTVTTIGGGGQALGGDDYVSRSTFDALDQAVTQLTPTTPGVTIAQKTASSVYDEFGAVRRATDYGGVVTATASDRAGRPTETFEDTPTAAAASTSQTVYDPSGRTISEKDRRQVAGSLGVTLYAYDELGRQIAVSVGDGTSHESEDDSTYDALDRLIALEVGVDGPGNPSPSSQLTTYVYDPGDRIVETDDQSSCGTSTYDYRDLPQTTTDGLVGGSCGSGTDTRTTTKTYDGRGRLLVAEVTAGPGTGDRTTIDAFDSVGNKLSTAVRKSGVTTTTTFGIDRLDQTTSEVRPDGSTAKTTYDAVGNALDRCFWKPAISVGDCLPVASSGWTNPPTQSTSTSYDARNERIGLVDGSSNQTTVYDSDHNYQTKALYTPTKADLTVELQTLTSYDDRHRVSEVKHQLCTISAGHACSSTTLVGESDYLYDDNDNRTKVLENNGAATTDLRYCYDALDRLQYRNTAAACGSAAKDETYVFDDAGNRTQTVVGGVTTNFAYDAEGRLCKTAATSCTSPNVTYDTAGRTKTWNGWTFGYDPDGRLLTACKSATCANTADKVEFTYDGEGHRTRILTDPAGTGAGQGPVTRTFRYQADAIVEETLTDATHTDAVVRSYVVDDTGSVVRMTIPAGEPGAGTYLPVYNGHGDTVNLSKLDPVTGSLTLANSFGYSTWGRPTTTTHNAIPDLGFRFAYVGEFDVQWDDAFGLDLLYMQARHYSPALGRFLQPDPDRSESNLYAYAANNPVTEIDPDGTCFIVCQLVVGAVIDSIVYLATTENASLDGLAGAVVSGAVESAVNPLAKISKVTKLVTAASKILIKVPKAVRKVQRAVNKSRGRSVASCTRHSFDAETLVTLADGSRVEIASLSVGDEVLAWDEASGKTGAYPITAVWAHDDAVTGIVVIDGEAIATTPGHPFYTVERGWVQAADLRTGDHVSSLAGAVGSVSSVTWLRGPDRMFDVTVANAHTFSVGTGAWLVHNANCRLSDVTVKSERAARRQAFRDHKIPTSIGGRPFERIKRYGTNPNLRGRRGEPSEEIRVRGRAPIEHHSNGHRFPDRVTGPHYHGAGRHIYYPSRK